jgi:hypothetical protein
MTLTDIIRKINYTMGEDEGTTPYYDWKLNETIDSVQREIATVGKIIKKNKFVTSESNLITLPSDVYEVIKLMNDENNIVQYVQVDKKTIQITEDDGEYVIVYYAYTSKLTSTTSRSTELEIPLEAQEALRYGVCAELNIEDDVEKYGIYKAKYETALGNILDVTNHGKAVTIVGGISL